MVLQKIGDIAGVVADHAGNRFILEKLLEGIVAGRQDGDIAQTVEAPKKIGWDKACRVSIGSNKTSLLRTGKRRESVILRCNSCSKVGTALGSSQA
jgi:hypothetical protein